MEELKKCPFCGGKAKMNKNSHINPKRYFIKCWSCEITMPSVGNGFNSKKEAIEAWNRRENNEQN